MAVALNINGRKVASDVSDDTPLLWAVREELGLEGTKFGCNFGVCDSYTVFISGVAKRSCITPWVWVSCCHSVLASYR